MVIDNEYIEATLQKAWKINFKYIKTTSLHVGGLSFIFSTREEAAICWNYVLHRLDNQKNVFTTLSITKDNTLEIVLDFRDLGVKIKTHHNNFNHLDLSVMIDHADFPYVDSVIHISCKYYKDSNTEPEEYVIHEDGISRSAIISKAYRFDNDGFQILPPPPLPSF